ncbi:DnaA ATPase domain-containing protein [Stieleria varia]|uniref:Chromosomal replication initiator protein DnaA n=1 Tax=Stieleria varia TaxID=2528005 RepID=A0A5C6A3H9_9BACT|nr:DnaA/Hda family protein [Stieleria varia]TWT93897.1 Chromosomal replication initiator protein DnaA [Stieleria varia]
MKEDCATGMAATHGCNDGKDVVEQFMEALKQRIGADRFDVWFQNVGFDFAATQGGIAEVNLIVTVNGQFALDRISKNFMPQLRGAASQAAGMTAGVVLQVATARQIELPLEDAATELNGQEDVGSLRSDCETVAKLAPSANGNSANVSKRESAGHTNNSYKRQQRRGVASLKSVLLDGVSNRQPERPVRRAVAARSTADGVTFDPNQPALFPEISGVTSGSSPLSNGETKPAPVGDPNAQAPSDSNSATSPTSQSNSQPTSQPTTPPPRWETFVHGKCNELAYTACRMVCESPSLAAPLFLWGPPGTGKSHLLHSLAHQLRRIHRLRRVITLSAEAFTNDFIGSVHNNGCGLPAFRSRYRDVDALLIDDIQFMGAKKATLRELLYTVETLAEAGRPMIFAGTYAPGDMPGLSVELAGRMAGGLVCQMQGLDLLTRRTMLQNHATQHCPIAWPTETLDQIAMSITGDGRVIHGIVNLISLLQRMNNRMPTMDEIRQFGGHLMRMSDQPVTLSAIERAVERVFQLPPDSMQTAARTKTVTEPRMLAMYLSREKTSSAFGEIGRHYGGRSHSTAILASSRVGQWLEDGRSIGRGAAAISVQEALQKVETLLRSG